MGEGEDAYTQQYRDEQIRIHFILRNGPYLYASTCTVTKSCVESYIIQTHTKRKKTTRVNTKSKDDAEGAYKHQQNKKDHKIHNGQGLPEGEGAYTHQ